MITVLMNVQKNEAKALARTLENLVHYAVEGFIQEVVVFADDLDDATENLADEAGCNIINMSDGFEVACQNARGDWLLFIEPGATLENGWAEAVSAHAHAAGGAANFKVSVSSSLPWWKRILAPATYKSPLAKGLFISKRQARANLSGKQSAADLTRGLAVKRLKAAIVPA